MKTLIAILILLASFETGLPAPKNAPTVEFASAQELICMVYGVNPCSKEGIENLAEIEATYNLGVVWLRDGWSAKSIRDISTLYHEIIHHMQDKDDYDCVGEMEKQAYDAQVKFLTDLGVEDPLALMEVNELVVLLLTMCRPGYR